MTIAELRTQYEAKRTEQEGLLGKGEGTTAEDITRAEALNGELRGIKEQIDTIGRAQHLSTEAKARDAEMTLPTTMLPMADGTKTLVAWDPKAAGETVLEAGEPEANGQNITVKNFGPGLLGAKEWSAISQDGYKEAFWAYMLAKGGFGNLTNIQQKTLQEGIDTSGGFLVPQDFLARIIMKKPTPVRVQNYVTTLNTSRDALTIPKVNYTTDDIFTTGIRVTWTGEIPASATTHRVTEPLFGQIRVPVFTAMMSIPVTNDLIEDSAVALLPWLEDRFTETIELLKDSVILAGTGISQPQGILLNPGGASQPAIVNLNTSGSVVTADGIIALGYSLPEQYDDEARWVFNKTSTGAAVAALKDGQSRYLWGMGYQDSGLAPPIRGRELLGYPVNFSGFMPNAGSNTFPIIFGDFRGYYLVNRIGLSIQVLRELYAETNQILLLARIRFGGVVAEEWRLRVGRTIP